MVALGGGAVGTDQIRAALRERASTVLVDIDVEEAWRARRRQRPAARAGRGGVPALYDERRPLYEEAADARARDVDGAVLAAGGVHVELGALERLGELFPARARSSSSATRGSPGSTAWTSSSRSARALRASHELPPGEEAKTVESLRGALACPAARARRHARRARRRLHDRRRRLRRRDVPARDRLGRRPDDARRPGRRGDRRQDGDRPAGRQEPRRRLPLAGADGDRPRDARDAAGGRARERPRRGREDGPARRRAALGAAARRAGATLRRVQDGGLPRDPHDRGERAQLNLGHTFAHALEAAAGFELPHGRAVALGLLAALRLSGLDTAAVEEVLRPEPARVDRDTAWAALARDKKAVDGVPRLVLLEAPGRPGSASSSPRPRSARRSTR